jgi:hypothetical protein
MSTPKAFVGTKHVDYSDHIRASKRDVANYRVALDYLQTGDLPPKMTAGIMYSFGMKYSVLRAFQAGNSCPSGDAFGGTNSTIFLICPGCDPNNSVPTPLLLVGGDNTTEAPDVLVGGTPTSTYSLIYVGEVE